MRFDRFLQNDSGALSVVSAAAVPAIVADERENDAKFLSNGEACLLLLQGDDALPVRVVVDEPLTAQEESEWLTRVRFKLVVGEGGALVAGGFDPSVFESWLDDGEHDGVIPVPVAPGAWRLDIYAHVGSLNGNALLRDLHERPGEAFRKAYPGRAIPLWLARMLDFSGEEDPGHEQDWREVAKAVKEGRLELDFERRSFAGFVFHFTPAAPGDVYDTATDGDWFEAETGARPPPQFPQGLASDATDEGMESEARRWSSTPEPKRAPILAKGPAVRVLESFDGEGVDVAPVVIPLGEAWVAWSVAGMATDATVAFEFEVRDAAGWEVPGPSEALVVERDGDVTRLGINESNGGWGVWWAAQHASERLASLPDGAQLTLAARAGLSDDPPEAPDAGTLLLQGRVVAGKWHVRSIGPRAMASSFPELFRFARSAYVSGLVESGDDVGAAALDRAIEEWGDMLGDDVGERTAEGQRVSADDVRNPCMIATPVYRARFGDRIQVDPPEEDGDDEDDE